MATRQRPAGCWQRAARAPAALAAAPRRDAGVAPHVVRRMLATLSVCGWLCGVGDRHPGNVLVQPRTGGLVPIDFGYSFGGATTVRAGDGCVARGALPVWCHASSSGALAKGPRGEGGARAMVCLCLACSAARLPAAMLSWHDAALVLPPAAPPAQILPIPELVPFRLTRQLAAALDPLPACEALLPHMRCALEALQASGGAKGSADLLGAMLALMQQEPLTVRPGRVGGCPGEGGRMCLGAPRGRPTCWAPCFRRSCSRSLSRCVQGQATCASAPGNDPAAGAHTFGWQAAA